MSFKSSFAGAAVAALVLAAPAATAFADNPGHGHAGTHANHGKSKMHFTANGKVTAVDATSLTMHVKGGSKALHGTDVTVSLADNAKVRRNGAKAQLSDLQVGDRVNTVGARAEDGTLTARHVNAHGPDAADSTDDSTAADSTDDGTDDSTGADTSDTDTTDTSATDSGSTDTGSTDPTG